MQVTPAEVRQLPDGEVGQAATPPEASGNGAAPSRLAAGATVLHPIQQGVVQNWDGLETLLHYVLYDEASVVLLVMASMCVSGMLALVGCLLRTLLCYYPYSTAILTMVPSCTQLSATLMLCSWVEWTTAPPCCYQKSY